MRTEQEVIAALTLLPPFLAVQSCPEGTGTNSTGAFAQSACLPVNGTVSMGGLGWWFGGCVVRWLCFEVR